MRIDTTAIGIESDNFPVRDGILYRQVFSNTERVQRALKMLVILWALALATVFVPIAHFVLVPTFLLAGPIVAFRRYGMKSVLEKAGGACPACGQEIAIPLAPGDRLPKRGYCPACNKPLRLVYNSPEFATQ